MRPKPTEADHGAMVWPIIRLWLDSDLDILALAEAAGLRVSVIRSAILRPGSSLPGTWGRIAYALGYRINFSLTPDSTESQP